MADETKKETAPGTPGDKPQDTTQPPAPGPEQKTILDRLDKLAADLQAVKAGQEAQKTEHKTLFEGLTAKLEALTKTTPDKAGEKAGAGDKAGKDDTHKVPVVLPPEKKPEQKPRRSWFDRLL